MTHARTSSSKSEWERESLRQGASSHSSQSDILFKLKSLQVSINLNNLQVIQCNSLEVFLQGSNVLAVHRALGTTSSIVRMATGMDQLIFPSKCRDF
jgi:hypothetical protein